MIPFSVKRETVTQFLHILLKAEVELFYSEYKFKIHSSFLYLIVLCTPWKQAVYCVLRLIVFELSGHTCFFRVTIIAVILLKLALCHSAFEKSVFKHSCFKHLSRCLQVKEVRHERLMCLG